MNKHEVRSAHDALAYLTDCTLATVSDLASKKSAGKHETSRQINIAQGAVDWMRAFGTDFSKTRAADVVAECGGSVLLWAERFRA